MLDEPKLTAIAQPVAGRELVLLASALGRPDVSIFHVGLDLAHATHWVCPADTWTSKMKVTLAALRYQQSGRVAIVTRTPGTAEAVCRALADAYGILATCLEGSVVGTDTGVDRTAVGAATSADQNGRSSSATVGRHPVEVGEVSPGTPPVVAATTFADLEGALGRQALPAHDMDLFGAMIFWSTPADLDQYVRLTACLTTSGKRPFALTLAPSSDARRERHTLRSAPPAPLFAHLADHLAAARRRPRALQSTESALIQAIPFPPEDVRSALSLMAEHGLACCQGPAQGPARSWHIGRPITPAELRRLSAVALIRHMRKAHAAAWWRRFEEAKRDRLAILRTYFEAPRHASHPLTKSRASASEPTSPATCASRMTSSTRPSQGPGSRSILVLNEAPSTRGGGDTRSR
ncbi:MAG: hypothetical protein ABIN37_15850 [Burkholderiaceae bacterium]